MDGDDPLKGAVPADRIYGMDLLDDLRPARFKADLVRVDATHNSLYSPCYLTARRSAAGAGAGDVPDDLTR